MNRSQKSALAALSALAAPVLFGVSPSSAAPPVFEEVTDPFSLVVDDYCGVAGLSAAVTGTYQSSLKIRTNKFGVQYYLEHVTVDSTVTGVESGRSVTIHTAYLAKDLKVTDNGDGTTTVVALLAGPSSVYGPDGKAIARDPGQFRFRVVISDAGTPADPEDDVEVSFEVLKESTGRSDDYCAAIVDVIG